MQLFTLISLTMIAFAGNSVFGRVGLGSGGIDPASYTLIRLAAGALMLVILCSRSGKPVAMKSGNWFSALALFGYAGAFSYAYVSLHTGIGALILFACVQGTMIGWALIKGDRPSLQEWLGLVVAFGAFVWLVSPGLQAPDPFASFLMAISGISWGIYSIRGKNSANPLFATSGNFIRSVPFAIALLIVMIAYTNIELFGAAMAFLSGAITSALGYALWYQVLGKISQTQAAIVQLSVPVLAGVGGLLFLNEQFSARFAISAILILGGVAMAILAKSKRV